MGMRPVPGHIPISQNFGAFPGGYNPPGGHTGTDYAAPIGTDVVAVADGKILWADWGYNMPGGQYDYHLRWLYDKNFPGILCVVEHDDCLTSPAHMNATHLNPGDYVKKGEILGPSGNTGTATTGSHVHGEVIAKPFNWGSPTYGRVDPAPYTREPYRVTSGAKSIAAWDNTPETGDPWLPGAKREPQPDAVKLDTSLPKRVTWHITSDVDPGKTQPPFDNVSNYLKREKFCPHIMWDPFTGQIVQYYPATVGSRALKAWNQDGAVHVQIEILFSRGAVRLGKQYWELKDTPLLGFNQLIQWLDAQGIPRTWPMGSPPPIGQHGTRNIQVWNTKAGHYGHSQVPGNDHTDPGTFPDITKVPRQTGAATPTGKDWFDMATQKDLENALENVLKKQRPRKGGVKGTSSILDEIAWNNKNFATVVGLLKGVAASVLNAKVKRPDGTEATLAAAVSYERENWALDKAQQAAILRNQIQILERLDALDGKGIK